MLTNAIPPLGQGLGWPDSSTLIVKTRILVLTVVSGIETLLDERSPDKGVVADTIGRNQGLRRESRKIRHKRSSDFQERCAGDVLKSLHRSRREADIVVEGIPAGHC